MSASGCFSDRMGGRLHSWRRMAGRSSMSESEGTLTGRGRAILEEAIVVEMVDFGRESRMDTGESLD